MDIAIRKPASESLCVSCEHGREIRSSRGSLFWLCGRSETDPSFPKYPRLPVLSCRGYEPRVKTGA